MEFLPLILISFLTLAITLNYLQVSYKKTAIELVNEMGIGINLGNSFDSYDISFEAKTPDDQITLWGNPIPTKQMIKNIKVNGFKTIRFPITWINFIDESGNINPEWILRIKEVVNWIINYNMFCIINVHHDGKEGNWLSKGMGSKKKFDKLWTQISNEFKDFNQFLVFEAMNEVEFKSGDNYDYETLYKLTQSFIDIIRNSGGKNSERLLIIPGANADYKLTISKNFIIPKDPFNFFAISIHYYNPYKFTKENTNSNENPKTKWGDEADYNEIMTNFYIMKATFTEIGIPIILGEVGVITEDQKEEESIREYIYAVFALAWEFDGIISCLWDTSNKNTGNMNYYNRETNKFYDKRIINFLRQISRNRFISFWDYFINTNYENMTMDANGIYESDIEDLTLTRIIFKVNFHGKQYDNFIHIFSYDKDGEEFEIFFNPKKGKKQYDGSTIYTINIKDECFYTVYVMKLEGIDNYIDFNYFLFEFKEYVKLFDFRSYSNAILDIVNNL